MNEYNSESFHMENEYETIVAEARPVGPSQANGGERYYTETIKQKKARKGGFFKFVIIAVICAVVAAPLLGLGVGAGMTLAGSYINVGTETAKPVSPKATEPLTVTAPTEGESNFTVNNVAKTGEVNSLVGVIKSSEASVVNITTSVTNSDPFYGFYFGNREQEGSGTGIIFKQDDENAYIMTNYHVIEGASVAYISFNNNEQVKANPVGANKEEDIAVISVKKTDLQSEGITSVSVATIGDSSTLEVGEWVVAIGNAVGNGKTATFGIISALDKEVALQGGRGAASGSPVNLIQTDAAINPGNSGGALINMNGDVIGMNTAKLQGISVEGMGFALPINSVKEIIDEIMGNKATPQPFIGISGASITADMVEAYKLIVSEGVLLDEVFENGGASDAGLRRGDIIIEFAGVKIKTIDELKDLISKQEIGAKVPAKIIRLNEREIEVTIEITNLTDVNPW